MKRNPMTSRQQAAYNRREAPYLFAKQIQLHYKPGVIVERASLKGGAVYMRPGGRSKNFLKFTYGGSGHLGAPLIKIETINIKKGTLRMLGYPKSIVADNYRDAVKYVDTILGVSTAVRNPCGSRRHNQVVSSINQAIQIALAEAPSQYAKSYAAAAMQAAQQYGMEGLRVQIMYLLNNLGTWRGPRAREVKAFMKAWLKSPQSKSATGRKPSHLRPEDFPKRRNPAALARQLLNKLVAPGETFTKTSLAAGMRASGMKGVSKYVGDFIRDAKMQGLIYGGTGGLYRRVTRAANPKRRSGSLSVPEKHQLKIARSTLRMSDVGARIMGGMSKDEARQVIKRLTGKAPNRSKK